MVPRGSVGLLDLVLASSFIRSRHGDRIDIQALKLVATDAGVRCSQPFSSGWSP